MTDLTAKVAAFVSDTLLALNAGENKGVQEGDQVIIYRKVEIEDPDSKEPLGAVRVPKLHLRVNHVQDKLCVAMVTDREGSSSLSQVLPNAPLKQIVQEAKPSNKQPRGRLVPVALGEEVVIKLRDVETHDEPPF